MAKQLRYVLSMCIKTVKILIKNVLCIVYRIIKNVNFRCETRKIDGNKQKQTDDTTTTGVFRGS